MERGWKTYDGDVLIDEGSFEVDWKQVRSERDQALFDSDWRAGKDVTLSTAWREFRQKLRDLPQDHAESNDAVDNWPVKPDD